MHFIQVLGCSTVQTPRHHFLFDRKIKLDIDTQPLPCKLRSSATTDVLPTALFVLQYISLFLQVRVLSNLSTFISIACARTPPDVFFFCVSLYQFSSKQIEKDLVSTLISHSIPSLIKKRVTVFLVHLSISVNSTLVSSIYVSIKPAIAILPGSMNCRR